MFRSKVDAYITKDGISNMGTAEFNWDVNYDAEENGFSMHPHFPTQDVDFSYDAANYREEENERIVEESALINATEMKLQFHYDSIEFEQNIEGYIAECDLNFDKKDFRIKIGMRGDMIALIACGGSGSRLLPMTNFMNKHLAPIGGGKLMIDLPLEYYAANGFKEVCLVTGSKHASQIVEYVGDGERYGFDKVTYGFQSKPDGICGVLKRIPQAQEGVLLILGDNYFSDNFLDVTFGERAICWQYDVGSLEAAKRFGQVFYLNNHPVDIIEKPEFPQHCNILVGLYYFPKDVFEKVEALHPSKRNELEITDLLKMYLKERRLDVLQVDGHWNDLGEWLEWSQFIKEKA